MQEYFASTLKALRKARGLSQEQLADYCGVTVQAVSKWECAQSCPDIALLPVLAEYFGVTVDYLLRPDGAELPAPAPAPAPAKPAVQVPLPDLPGSDRLRILWCRGQTVLYDDPYIPDEPIPLRIPEGELPEPLSFEIAGSAQIFGSISGNVAVGFGIECGDIHGNATAGDSIRCKNIGGSAASCEGITCQAIGGNAKAGDSIWCENIGGDASAGDEIHCSGRIDGEIFAGE